MMSAMVLAAKGVTGDTVVITGTNFQAPLSVVFGGDTAAVHSFNASQISAQVPAGTITGPIKVTDSYGSVTTTTSFTVEAPPTITRFSPTSGKVGDTIAIAGTNFSAPLAVIFGGNVAAVHSLAPTQINAQVPSGAKTGVIRITTSYGRALSATSFTVTP